MTEGSRLDKRGEDMVKYEGDKLLFNVVSSRRKAHIEPPCGISNREGHAERYIEHLGRNRDAYR